MNSSIKELGWELDVRTTTTTPSSHQTAMVVYNSMSQAAYCTVLYCILQHATAACYCIQQHNAAHYSILLQHATAACYCILQHATIYYSIL